MCCCMMYKIHRVGAVCLLVTTLQLVQITDVLIQARAQAWTLRVQPDASVHDDISVTDGDRRILFATGKYSSPITPIDTELLSLSPTSSLSRSSRLAFIVALLDMDCITSSYVISLRRLRDAVEKELHVLDMVLLSPLSPQLPSLPAS
mmetsp:Transcript_10905/g.33432  ORF Transcript_10905/g.33432 Transcript_10905/m.33432 type:complete len:148 (-) Transcript_10905:72-515(-)